MRNAALALSIHLISAAAAVEIRVATFNIGAHFGETFFDYSLGDAGTPDHDTVRAILARIDADVVALQEVHSVDLQGGPNDLDNLAESLGYPHAHVPPVAGVFDTSLRVVILSRYPFLTTGSIGSPAGAKEITRLHAVVKVDVPGTTRDPVVICTHLKAGTESSSRFRRAVEMKRLTGYLNDTGLTDGDNFIILGDFNPSSVSRSFDALPSGVPGSYVLGADVTFPVNYSSNPLGYFSTPVAARLDPRQLDGSDSTYDTLDPDGPTLDLILVSPAIARRPHAAEVYNSALDDSNGTGLAKAGAPPGASISSTASDHHAVFADLDLDSSNDAHGSYVFTVPGQFVAEDFSGFAGDHDPPRWTTSGGLTWRGIDDGSANTPGLRAYGWAADPSLGFLHQGTGTTATAAFVNQSAVPVTALRIALDVEQWRAATTGTADGISAEWVIDGERIPLPGLSFVASRLLSNGPVAGGATTALLATATGLSIPPGASFGLRVSFHPGVGGSVFPEDVFVNEFHYDNDGTDAGEFIEIAVAPGFTGQLADIDVVLYNGDGGGVSATHGLDTFAAGATTASGHRLYHKWISGIQNGAPDGIAIINTAASQVLHFISYEGAFTATNGPASGLISTDIGVSQGTNEIVGQAALGLTGMGGNAEDFTWTKFTGIAHSPGQANAGQAFMGSAVPPQGLAIDNLSVTYLIDSDLDGLPNTSDSDDDNDGQSDAEEVAFGTDPLDSGSRFVPVIASTGAPRHGFELSFAGAQGISYTIECSRTLAGWQDHSIHLGNGQPIVVSLPSAEATMFFRVRAGISE
jgi:endonuclease/exonuclease/phosphatase family metal-dependent hydrolase